VSALTDLAIGYRNTLRRAYGWDEAQDDLLKSALAEEGVVVGIDGKGMMGEVATISDVDMQALLHEQSPILADIPMQEVDPCL
jgi:hypothetical protein